MPIGLSVGCKDEPPAPAAKATATRENGASEPDEASSSGSGPIATVNGEPVSRERFERELAQSKARYEAARKSVQPELLDNLRRSLVRRMVEAEVVRQKAAEWGIAPPTEELDAMWTKHRERFGTDDSFRAFLERAGTTEDDLKQQFINELLMDRVKQRLEEQLALNEDELRTYYETRKEHFAQPEEVRVSQILIQLPPGSTDEQEAAQREKAEETLKTLRGGADFASVARRVSDGPAATRGGDLGFLPRGRLVPAVEAKAFELEPGQISDVIPSRFGFHIISVAGRREARQLDFEQARPAIERRIRAQALRREVHEAIERWKREMDIQLFEDTDLYTRSPSQREVSGPRILSDEARDNLRDTSEGGPGPIDLKSLPEGFRPTPTEP